MSKNTKNKKSKKGYYYCPLLVNLEKRTFSKQLQDLIDFDYIDELNEEDKRYLAKFISEYYGGNIKKDKSKLSGNNRKDRGKGYSEENLHQKPEHIKECRRRANKHKKTEILSYAKAGNKVIFGDEAIKIKEHQSTKENGHKVPIQPKEQSHVAKGCDKAFLYPLQDNDYEERIKKYNKEHFNSEERNEKESCKKKGNQKS